MNDPEIKEAVRRILELPELIPDAHWAVLTESSHYQRLREGSDDVEGLAFHYEFILEGFGRRRSSPRRPRPTPMVNAPKPGQTFDPLPFIVAQEAGSDPYVLQLRSLWGGHVMSPEAAKDWLQMRSDSELLQFCHQNTETAGHIMGEAFRRSLLDDLPKLKKLHRSLTQHRTSLIEIEREILAEIENAKRTGGPECGRDMIETMSANLEELDREISSLEETIDQISNRKRRALSKGEQPPSKAPVELKPLPSIPKDRLRKVFDYAHQLAREEPPERKPLAGVILAMLGSEHSVAAPYYNPDGLLKVLDESSEILAWRYSWRGHEALTFLLVGWAPSILQRNEVYCTRKESPTFRALDRISMEIDPTVSPRDVMEAYAQERSKIIGRNKPMSPKHTALGWFLGTDRVKACRTWTEKMSLWNSEMKSHPDTQYNDAAIFRRDAEAARRRILNLSPSKEPKKHD